MASASGGRQLRVTRALRSPTQGPVQKLLAPISLLLKMQDLVHLPDQVSALGRQPLEDIALYLALVLVCEICRHLGLEESVQLLPHKSRWPVHARDNVCIQTRDLRGQASHLRSCLVLRREKWFGWRAAVVDSSINSSVHLLLFRRADGCSRCAFSRSFVFRSARCLAHGAKRVFRGNWLYRSDSNDGFDQHRRKVHGAVCIAEQAVAVKFRIGLQGFHLGLLVELRRSTLLLPAGGKE
mmetsp:Transcript_93113/g.216386  ORF Transcript_93113/g.216386 Transcript_93113/m.216386 type:complete len:239 (+) Transcript_93113:1-717(+)